MVLPQAEFIQVPFISGRPDCDYTISTNIPDLSNIRMRVIDYYEKKFVKTTYCTLSHRVRITTETNGNFLFTLFSLLSCFFLLFWFLF